ncbi:MAG: hypothetical protein HY296_03175 [Thaumarchaeota archaeon]|nr:hypothetical protein [Nitrososphaerota archaeon]
MAVIEKTKSRTNTIKNLYAITDRGYWMSCSLIGPGADPDRILESNPHLPKECKAIAEAWKVAPELYARWLGLAASQITSTDPRKVMREAITILIPMIAGMPEGQQDEARRIILSAPESKALLRATIEEAKSLLADFDKP